VETVSIDGGESTTGSGDSGGSDSKSGKRSPARPGGSSSGTNAATPGNGATEDGKPNRTRAGFRRGKH
jgi:hypothetical protein